MREDELSQDLAGKLQALSETADNLGIGGSHTHIH